MNIGFYFECSKRSGGAYQYALNLLDALKEIKEHKYTVFNISNDFPFSDFKLANWEIINIIPIREASADGLATTPGPSLKRKFNLFILELLRRFKLYSVQIFLERLNSQKRADNFLGHNLDIMFFHGPSELSFLTGIPSVLPIHDLNHIFYPQFPELSQKGQYQKREYINKNIIKNVFRILVDSDVGKEDIIKTYSVEPKRIEVFPPTPPNYLQKNISDSESRNIIKKYNLPDRFMFYPAQFWPHKNHQNLIRAIGILKNKGIIVNLVLVGTKQDLWGEYDRVIELIKREELGSQIYFLGYVDNREMSALYLRAVGLAMPTRVGWTYIPIVEAWYMGCPVLYSDVRGCKEQGGDAVLICDPSDPKDIADKLQMLWSDHLLREELVGRGYSRLGHWTKDDVNKKVREIINDFKNEKFK